MAIIAAGCKTSAFPDPNDPARVGKEGPQKLLDTLAATSNEAFRRVAKGEISDEQAQKIVSDRARELAKGIRAERVPAEHAWRYGELFRTAKMWRETEAVLATSVKKPENEDRRIIDTLRLAQAKANLGKVDEAVDTAMKVMDARPYFSAPILPAVLFEIEPLLEGKGKDSKVAGLVEEAITKHERTLVNPNSDGGKAFMLARKHHLEQAYDLVVRLYHDAEDEKGEAAAREKRKKFYADYQSA